MQVTLPTKVTVILNSVVTWATTAAFVVSTILTYLQINTGVLPDNWVGPVIAYGGSALAFLTAITAIIKKVMPVPASGVLVVEPGQPAKEVTQGWV